MVDRKPKGKMRIGQSNSRRPQNSVPAELLGDERFRDVATDPKFRPIPKSEGKIKIDQRFGEMFTDKRFKIKATMDKRGRPVTTTSSEDLKRFYHMENEEREQTESEREDDEDATRTVEKPALKTRSKTTKDGGDDAAKDEKKQSAITSPPSDDELLDFARGEGNLETSDDDSSDSSEDEEEKLMREEAEQEIEWDELDKDVPRSDDVSKRLALCNMDWQNVKADDLFVLMNSFAPEGGIVHCVRIFPSEFGKERMEAESNRGPRLDSKNSQALRKYEFERLRYYYAVVECNDEKTANAIYESCDGMEFQTSGTKLDLRFIPDEMEFDESEQTDSCDSMPSSYEPVDFVNTALMQSTCESTFDSEDLRRKKALGKLYSKDSKKAQRKKGQAGGEDPFDHMAEHLKTYIASSDDDDDDEEGATRCAKKSAGQYRNLLLGANERQEDSSPDDDGDKEITFNPDLNAAVEKAKKEKDDREKSKKTPFQEYLEKKKQKKRERRLAETVKRKRETTFSDDELPAAVDESHDFFKQALSDDESKLRDESGSEADGDSDGDNSSGRKKRQEEELELLLMDEEDDSKKHFSLRKILKNEKQPRKNKNKRKQEDESLQDDFKVNVNDSRFGAIYTDHRFNIDPTDASFKRTKAMDAVLAEKTKRRKKISPS